MIDQYEPVIFILACLALITIVGWVFLPLAIFGTKPRIDEIILLLRELNDKIDGKG